MTTALELIEPDWPAPRRVRAVMTTRTGGVSRGPYASFNLASHVGDDEAAVTENRRRLRNALQLPSEPAWLAQVHSTGIATLPVPSPTTADAAVAFAPRQVCTVLVADCLPVIFASVAGDRVGIAHAGWRGLAAGVLEATVTALACDPEHLMAWLGPAIGPSAFEVGAEVRESFVTKDTASSADFQIGSNGRFFADLPALARRQLHAAGVHAVFGGTLCTHADASRFYSYRRDGATGRMAALAWLG